MAELLDMRGKALLGRIFLRRLACAITFYDLTIFHSESNPLKGKSTTYEQ